jgi:hypothetical protein
MGHFGTGFIPAHEPPIAAPDNPAFFCSFLLALRLAIPVYAPWMQLRVANSQSFRRLLEF